MEIDVHGPSDDVKVAVLLNSIMYNGMDTLFNVMDLSDQQMLFAVNPNEMTAANHVSGYRNLYYPDGRVNISGPYQNGNNYETIYECNIADRGNRVTTIDWEARYPNVKYPLDKYALMQLAISKFDNCKPIFETHGIGHDTKIKGERVDVLWRPDKDDIIAVYTYNSEYNKNGVLALARAKRLKKMDDVNGVVSNTTIANLFLTLE